MLLLALLTACAPVDDTSDPADVIPTDAGLYQLTTVWDPAPPSVGDTTLLVDVATADGTPVPDATLTLDVTMPMHGHGLSDPPTITPDGDGGYACSWTCPMAGEWQVVVTVDGSEGTDSATITVDVE